MAIKKRCKPEAGFSMSSMTDIVFLLLIFFLVTSTLISPNALKLLLPKSDGQVSEKPMMSVSIQHHLSTNTFTYSIDGDGTVPYNQLESSIRERLDNEEDPIFSIHADKTVPIENVVDLMNIARRNRYKVILATTKE